MKHGKLFLFLAQITGIGRKTLHNLKAETIEGVSSIADFTSIARELAEKNKRIHIPDNDKLLEYMNSAESILTNHEKLGISMITKYDLEYPQKLVDIPTPAPYFFIKGNTAILNKRGIAVIGTREPSDYGRRIAGRLGEFVAERGLSVISGLAEGCDTAAHAGCLNGQGYAVAVVATPLDRVYPKSNTELLEKILSAGGCAVSEYPIGTNIGRYAFVERDRLQCGLADGIIVAETGKKSGTFNAVNGALALRKPIGCFSYDTAHYQANIQSQGNLLLIEQNKATALHDLDSMEAFIKECLCKSNIQNSKIRQSKLF